MDFYQLSPSVRKNSPYVFKGLFKVLRKQQNFAYQNLSTYLLDILRFIAFIGRNFQILGIKSSSFFVDQLEKELPNWKQKDGKKLLPSAVDIQNCCGYITLLSLDDSDDGFFDGVVQTGNGNNLPRNGEMNEENLDLLKEEVDNIPDTSMMGTKPKSLGPLDIAAGQKAGENWILLDIKYGVPLFDSELNKAICEGIKSNNLWKSDNLSALKSSGQELCQALNNFIISHQDLNGANSKIWTTPEERRKSPVPLPTRVLFFDGQVLHDKL